ncbi:MAG TPA: beta-ketoacyl synthase, partial [Gemmata sp.]|nr:beta-ketoacyl synthase [Gemmata sp.]
MVVTVTQPSREADPQLAPWDSRLCVIRGQDRDDLRDRIITLAASFEGREVPLSQIAQRLAAELQPAGERLAIVASSHDDLAKKLRRASERLADPRCKHIRDSGGVYYFSEPLYPQGSLALLFPGEGAQYPDMLLDLCRVFPEVEESFAWCDQLAAEAGRPEDSLRRMLHLPPNASVEERSAAEASLRQLGPSIFGVLLADQAIYRVL